MLARRRSEWAYFCGRLVSKVVVFWDPKCSGHWHFVSFIIRDCWLGSTTRGSTLTIPGWHSLAVWEQRALILVGFISHVSRRAGGFTLLAQSTFGPKYCSAQFRSRRCRDTQKPAFFFATKTLFLSLEAELWTQSPYATHHSVKLRGLIYFALARTQTLPRCKFIRRAKQEPLKNPFAE